MKLPFGPRLNIAHRGARSLAPENTLLSAQKAYDVGADMWEMDTAMTSDGELVVIHDDTLPRTSNAASIYPERAPWEVHTFTLAELRRLDFGTWYLDSDPFLQIAAGNVSQAELHSYHNAQIPTLSEALQFTRDHSWRVNVEIKDLAGKPGDSAVVEQVMQWVEGLGMMDRVMISSFNHSYMMRAKGVNQAIATAALVEEPADDPLRVLQAAGAEAYNPGITGLLNLNLIAELRKKGYDVFVWTVNDEATMRQLINAGVSGIITDYPQILKQVLGSPPKKFQNQK